MAISMKAARVNANMTMQQIADALGVHVQTYSHMEKHPDAMTIQAAKLFAKTVGMSVQDIFFDSNSN